MKTAKEEYPKLQKAIKKLISEEYLAGQLYKLYTMSIGSDQLPKINDLMLDTSKDELEDHMDGLAKCARNYGFDIPCTLKDFLKYASENAVKQFEAIKRDQDVEYYAKEGIKSEVDAINSYKEIIEDNAEDLPFFPELQATILNNYNDEIEHLEKFKFLGFAADLGDLIQQ